MASRPTIHLKKKLTDYLPSADKIRQEQIRHFSKKKNKAKKGSQGERVKAIKEIQSREGGSHEIRIKQLLKLAHEVGLEKIVKEIEVHERKLAELREVLSLLTTGSG